MTGRRGTEGGRGSDPLARRAPARLRKLSDRGLTHRGLVLRRFDGILRFFLNVADFCGIVQNFADFFAESLNPNRPNPNRLTAENGMPDQVAAKTGPDLYESSAFVWG